MRIAIPKNLVNYIRIKDNEIVFKQDLPNELQNDYENFEKEFKKSLSEFKSINKSNERNVKRGNFMKSITKEELMEILEKVIEEHQERIGESVNIDEKTKNAILDIVVKINNFKSGIWTSIAKLIDYNPENGFVEPLMQGTISMYVRKVCKKLGIEFIDDNSIGGLAYMIKFKKCDSVSKRRVQMKLKVTKYGLGIVPNAQPSGNEYIFELKKSKNNNAGIIFDIVKVDKDYVVLNIHCCLNKGFKQYVFDGCYPITLEKKLEGAYSKYTFELIWA